jgi:hypothetical protein
MDSSIQCTSLFEIHPSPFLRTSPPRNSAPSAVKSSRRPSDIAFSITPTEKQNKRKDSPRAAAAETSFNFTFLTFSYVFGPLNQC